MRGLGMVRMAEVDLSEYMEMSSDKFKRCFKYLAEPYLKERGLKVYHILFIYNIGNHPGTSQKQLRAHLPYDKSRVSMVITDLTDMDMVENVNDGKISSLYLTDRGKVIYSEVKTFALDFKKRLLNGFTDDERAVLIRCMDKFDRNMDVILDEGDRWTAEGL